MPFLPLLHRLLNKESLSSAEAQEAMSEILAGNASTPQITAFLAALRVKGETADEILGLALGLRQRSVRVEHGITGRPVLDTCGTGGDGQGTLNVSTIVAFVVAGCGVAIAKHGNRSHSSHCGSADLIEALGGRLLTDPAELGRCLREVGFTFLFAPAMHPALKTVQSARAELKTRTAFNLLGPLSNPAGATAQLVGAPSVQAAELMAVTLSSLGLSSGYVVHGEDGLDEVSTTAPTHLFRILRGAIDHSVVTPEDFGVPRATIAELKGGDIARNRDIALAVLAGEKGPYADIVLVNAALALMAAGAAAGIPEGLAAARKSIHTSAARLKLEAFVAFTRSSPVV